MTRTVMPKTAMTRTAMFSLLLTLPLIAAHPGSSRVTARFPADVRVTDDDPETVDFGRAPAPGTAFRLRESGVYRVTGSLDLGEECRREITVDVKQELRLVQRIESVAGARVERLTRSYEVHTLDAKQVSRDPQNPDAESRTVRSTHRHPLAGRTLRATWAQQGGSLALEERAGAGWKAAPADVTRRLTTATLLYPVLPLSAGPRQVGDHWTLQGKALTPYFADAYAENQPTPKIEGTAEVVFTGFVDHASGRCAVLTLSFDVTARYANLPPHRMRMKGSCLFHLQHRIVVALQAAGSMVARGAMQQGEDHGQMDLSGTIRSQSVAEILSTAAAKRDE